VAHDAALGALAHQRDQRLEFAQGIRIAAAVAGDDGRWRAVRSCRRAAPRCASSSGGGSIWLSMGVKVRMSMMLMSLNSVSAQSASLPCHSASPRVRFSQTSVGWSD
jgi:hypothetical protein